MAQSANKQNDTVTCLGMHFSLELILVTVKTIISGVEGVVTVCLE
jgi:hypothetical protein